MKTIILSTTLALFLFSGCGGGGSKDEKVNSPTTTLSTTSKVNKAPIATFDKFSINKGLRYNGQLNATDPDGDEIKYTIVKQPSHGTVVLHDNGCFTYTPDDGYKGKDTFSYRVSDDVSSCAVKTVTVDVCEKPLAKPTAPSDLKLEALSTSKIKITWSDNATNEDGYEVFIDGNLVRVKKANHTMATVCGLHAGQTYTVEVRAKNAAGVSESILKTITTKDVTTIPIAPTELKVKSKDETSVRLSWKDNANNESSYEIYQDGVKVKTVSSRCSCALICNLDPCKNYTFEVRAKNKIGESTGDTVDVKTDGCTMPINQAPVANEINVTTQNIDPVSITLLGTDPDGDTLTYTIVTQPTLGTLSGTAPNLTYTPFTHASNESPDSFTYKVNDGSLNSNVATVHITINSVTKNHAPIARPQNIILNEDTQKTVTLAGTDTDADPLTYSIVTPPNHGTFDGTTYTPNPNYFGNDSFTFKANDGTVNSTPATVSIIINPINDAPTVDLGGDVTITEGENITVNSHAADIDGTVVNQIWTVDGLEYALLENSQTITIVDLKSGGLLDGKHEVKVHAIDNDGASSEIDTMIITVLPATTQSKLLKTGQKTSYNENGAIINDGSIKDDGFYQAGADRNFTRDDIRDIVKDNVSGQIWNDNSDVGFFTLQYVRFDDYTVNDYCKGILPNGTAPTIEELFYLMNHETSFDLNNDGDHIFKHGLINEGYWSSTSDVNDPNYAWIMSYVFDLDGWAKKSENRTVRCVSNRNNAYKGSFTRDDASKTVTDTEANLVWQDNEAVKTRNKVAWIDAIEYCENLNFADSTKWRLPNINELYSLGDRSKYNPAIRTAFKNVVLDSDSDYYWSSTSAKKYKNGKYYANLAQVVEFKSGNTTRLNKSANAFFGTQQFAYVRCVRTK